MKPRDGQLVRPLLSYTREETAAYCRQRNLPWREDQSNQDPAYARNRVRAELVPAIKRIHPAAERNVLTLSSLLREEAEVLDALVEATLAGGSEISLAALRDQPPALQRLIVQRLADDAIGGPAPGVARRADEIAAMGPAAILDLPRVRARTEHGVLRFEKLAA
jgi:tRNA(Ile)-lysidine synthase